MNRFSTLLAHKDHRPFCPPKGPWMMTQSWCDLLFAHWPVSAATLRELVPPKLEIDTFEGTAFIGVVPFRMENVGVRFGGPFPGASRFLELNVRTYVRHKGVAGVYFFSLDATSALAVYSARRFYNLPYFKADMTQSENLDGFTYTSKRSGRNSSRAVLHVRYQPKIQLADSSPGSLAEFLTERYCLFVESGGQIYRGDVHHKKWPLRLVEASFQANTMTECLGIGLGREEPILHYAREMDTIIWPLARHD